MTPTQAQIEASKELAQVMKEKGIKWEWDEGDKALALRWFNRVKDNETLLLSELVTVNLITPDKIFTACRGFITSWYRKLFDHIPIPDFERCQKLLEDWGWTRYVLYKHDPNGLVTLSLSNNPEALEGDIRVEAPDPTTAAIKACVDAVRRR